MAQVRSRESRLLKKAVSRTRACASPEQLDGLADPDARLWAHVASCPRCQAERTLLGEFEAASPLPHEQATVSWISMRLERRFASDAPVAPRGGLAEPWWRRWFTFRSFNTAGLALAMAMLAVAVSVGLRDQRNPTLSAPTGAAASSFRSGDLTLLSPAGDFDEAPAELRWQALPAAASYSVRVMEVDRVEVWSTETHEPRAALPQQVRARVVPGKPLLWQVTAKDASGTRIAESALQRFRMRLPKR